MSTSAKLVEYKRQLAQLEGNKKDPAKVKLRPRDKIRIRFRCRLCGRARAVYFPGGLESFGYPLAEARAGGRPVIARDTTQNQEIAGAALCGYTPGDPASLELAVINSGVSHSNAAGEYNTRRSECERACGLLGVASLRDLDAADLPRIAALPAPMAAVAMVALALAHTKNNSQATK